MNSLGPPHSSIDQVLCRLDRLRQEKYRVVVAIDGRAGAGKSSFARALVAKLPKRIHIEHDWFHFPKNEVTGSRRFDHARLISEIILPFRSGASKLTFLRYNWGYLAGMPDGFHETPITVEDKEILVIEGCETLHLSLVNHLDFRIWLDTAPELSLERGIRPDIDEYKLEPERVMAAWKE